MDKESLKSELLATLPAICTRRAAAATGLVAAGTLANADSAGKGPRGRVRLNKKTVYPRAELVAWLLERLQ
jgi:hypothetical protein